MEEVREVSSRQDTMTRSDIPVDAAKPVPDMLHALIAEATERRATDIHLDPLPEGHRLRLRIDGVIYDEDRLSSPDGRRLINQIKVAAELDIEALHEPTEGRFTWRSDGASRDVRVTMIPTFHTEAVHLRLLVAPAEWREVIHLGLTEHHVEQIRKAMSHPHGLILVSGSTGAGKTTTLYALACMEQLANSVVMSIEDPIEFELSSVRQLQVDERREVTMSEGLRFLLRMDPDVLLVGEVRDRDSAVTAAQAAQSGQLVLASLHSRDAAAAVDNMHSLGVPYYILGDSLRLVICQNLVRKLCLECRRPRELRPVEAGFFQQAGLTVPERVFDAVGCPACHNLGFLGRTGVFEVVSVDDELGYWLGQGRAQMAIRKRFRELGERSFVGDALCKVADGITSLPEAMRFYGDPLDRAPALLSGIEPA